MHFFSFFDVLPSVPTTTGMTLMLLMFHIILIFLFSSWHLSIFSFSFSLTLMSPGIAISIMAQLLSFLFTFNNIRFSCLDLSVTLDHNIPQNIYFFIFSSISWSMFIPFFNLFQVVFPTQLTMNYSCSIIMPSLVLLLCQLFTFTHNMRYCFTFLGTHSTKSRIACSCTAYNMASSFKSAFAAITLFLFHLLFVAFLLQTAHAFCCFSIVPSFPSSIFV